VRTLVVGLGLVALVAGYGTPAAAQWMATDARRIGMGGLALGRTASVVRFNPAYRAVPPSADRRGQPKFTIPIPLGLIQFFHDHPLSHISDDPMFNPDSAGFNPVVAINTVLHPPLFLQLKEPPTPTNDWIFTVGRDQLVVDLGKAQQLIPEDQFGLGGSARPIDPGLAIKGVRVSLMTWFHGEAGFQLGDTLLGFLRNAQPAQHNTPYTASADGLVESGFAPTIGYAGRIAGDTATGFYVGGALHYYVGVGYWRTEVDSAGFQTGSIIFAGPNPVTPVDHAVSHYSKPGNTLGHAIGGDVGLAFVSGPIELGVGVNDIGATITWPNTRTDTLLYDQVGDTVYSTPGPNHVTTKTELPVSYIANVAYTVGKTTLGADVLNSGRGTIVHVGGEQQVGVFVVRGGVARDQRKRIQFGWGGGLRFGSFGLDAGFWTYSSSLSNERGISLATSVSVY